MTPTRSGAQYLAQGARISASTSHSRRRARGAQAPESSNSDSPALTLVPLGQEAARDADGLRDAASVAGRNDAPSVSPLPDVASTADYVDAESRRDSGEASTYARRSRSPSAQPRLAQVRLFSDVAADRAPGLASDAAPRALPERVDAASTALPVRVEAASFSSRELAGREARDDDGFHQPRSPLRRLVKKPSSSSLASEPRYFPEWFGEADDVPVKREEESVSLKWSEYDDNGDIGEIPAHWADTHNGASPGTEVSFRNTVPLSVEVERALARLDEKLRPKEQKGTNSRFVVSPKKPGRSALARPSKIAAHAVAVEIEDVSDSEIENYNPLDKGRGVNPSERTGIPPPDPSSSSETDDERDKQIALDYETALKLQKYLEGLEGKTSGLMSSEKNAPLDTAGLRGDLGKALSVSARSRLQESNKGSKLSKRKTSRQKSTGKSRSKSRDHGSKRSDKPTGRHDRASSLLPKTSNLRAALTGKKSKTPGSPSGSSSSDSDSSSSSDSGGWKRPAKREFSGTDDSSELFPSEPDSVVSSDCEATKHEKKRAKRRYKKKLMRLRYAQNFLKLDPPFVYKGEVQADVFQKWVREVRLYLKYSGLKSSQGLLILGKYLGGSAYKWYSREVLTAQKDFTLSEFFTELFDYTFPPDFRSEQRDAFDDCHQRGCTVREFLQNLLDISNTVGDYDERDIVVGFWRRCDSYLRVELTKYGYSQETLTLKKLEEVAMRLERTHKLVTREAKRSNGDSSSSRHERSDERRERHDDRERHSERSTSPDRTSGTSDLGEKADEGNDMQPRPGLNRGMSDDHKPQGQDREAERSRRRKLRKEGKCFNCESLGHLLKDCPEHAIVRPSASLQAATMDLHWVEEHRALKDAASLGLLAVSFDVKLETIDNPIVLLDESESDLAATDVNRGADSMALLLEAPGMSHQVGHGQQGMLLKSNSALDTIELQPSHMQRVILQKHAPSDSPTAATTESLEGAGDGEMEMEGEKPEALSTDTGMTEAMEREREGEKPEALLTDAGVMAAAPVAAGGTDGMGRCAVEVLPKQFEASKEMQIANTKREASQASQCGVTYAHICASPQGRGDRGPGRSHDASRGIGEPRFLNLSKTFNENTAPSGSGTSAAGETNSQSTPSSASPNGGPPRMVTRTGTSYNPAQTTGSAAAAGASTSSAGSNASSDGLLTVETTSVAPGSNESPEVDGVGTNEELGDVDEDTDHDMEEVLF